MLKLKLIIGFLVVALVAVGVYFLLLPEKEGKAYRVGILTAGAFPVCADGFKAGMAELGYIEGKNIVYDSYYVEADFAEMKRIAKEVVVEEVDLIFTAPTEPSQAAQEATQGTDIPIVFAYAGIEGSGLVESVREPGGNITGVRFPGPEQITRRLEMLLEFAPWVKRVWIGYDENYPNTLPALEALRPLAASKGVTLVEAPVITLGELEADLAARAKSADIGLDAMILMPDIFNHCPEGWGMIRDFATEHKVLLCGSFFYTVEEGAIFGNANDLFKVGELSASLADKILRDIPAGTIPVVTPEQDLWINYKVAQELGLTVPESLLNMAVEVIR